MSRLDDLFYDDDSMTRVHFSYRSCGKSISLNNDYVIDVTWDEVLDDVIRTLESHYGYTFDLTDFLVKAGRNDG
jgi:hypothetical protein